MEIFQYILIKDIVHMTVETELAILSKFETNWTPINENKNDGKKKSLIM